MELVKQEGKYEVMEKVIGDGDLSKLSPLERLKYYNQTCQSLGLNPLTQPFKYIRLNNKLTLYTTKDATEQLRQLHGVSIFNMTSTVMEGVYIVTVNAKDKTGREDIGTGAVTIEGLKGEIRANAILKAETKAKRRVTLSICGLGFLDESEIDHTPNAESVPVNIETGEIISPMIEGDSLIALKEAINQDELKIRFLKLIKLYAHDEEILKQIVKIKDNKKLEFEMMQADKS